MSQATVDHAILRREQADRRLLDSDDTIEQRCYRHAMNGLSLPPEVLADRALDTAAIQANGARQFILCKSLIAARKMQK